MFVFSSQEFAIRKRFLPFWTRKDQPKSCGRDADGAGRVPRTSLDGHISPSIVNRPARRERGELHDSLAFLS